MNLAPLLAAFPPDGPPLGGAASPAVVAEVVSMLGGVTLAGGLYRVFAADSVDVWTAVAEEGFPKFAGRVTVFGGDWLGRLLAADSARLNEAGEPYVLLLEPGTGEVLEIPATVAGVHSVELLEAADALVAENFYRSWRLETADARPLALTECVGYRVPLFLGGTDDVSNLERTDMDVYWSLMSQMRQQAVRPAVDPAEAKTRRSRLGRRRG